MQIEKDKFYKTRDGRKVEIYSTDNGGLHPVHGRIKNFDGTNTLHVWTNDGKWDGHKFEESKNDLIAEWFEPVTVSMSFNHAPFYQSRYATPRHKDGGSEDCALVFTCTCGFQRGILRHDEPVEKSSLIECERCGAKISVHIVKMVEDWEKKFPAPPRHPLLAALARVLGL